MVETQKIRRSTKHEKKMRWLADHDEEVQRLYVGMWLALTDDGLVATGDTFGAAYDAAESNGCSDPLVLYVRDKGLPHSHPILKEG